MRNARTNMLYKTVLVHCAGAAALTTVSLTLWCGVISPLMESHRHVQSLGAQLTSKQAELDRLNTFRQQLGKQIELAHQSIQDLHIDIKPADTLNVKLSEIAELASRGGLQIDSINPTAVESGKTLQAYPLQVSGRGTYKQFADFLREVRLSHPDTNVRSFQLRADGNTSNAAACAFNMTLLWCAQNETSSSASVAP